MSDQYLSDRVVGTIPPPPGQTSNFLDPVNHDARMIALHTVCLTLATFFVSLRVYLRLRVTAAFGADDVFCIIGWAFSVATSAILLKAMTLGLGRHLWDVPQTQAIEFGEWLFISSIITSPAWCFVKLAFLWSFKRAFSPSKVLNWLCFIGVFIVTAFYVGEVFHDIFVCTPVQKDWNLKLPGHCLPNGVGGSATAIFNTITDLMIIILPMPFIWSLHMSTPKKLRVTAVFLVGIFVNVCSIARLAITYETAKDKDVSWKVYKQSVWATLELNIGLVCVSVLVLKKFWKQVVVTKWYSLRSKMSDSSLTRGQSASTIQYATKGGEHNAPWDKQSRKAGSSGSVG